MYDTKCDVFSAGVIMYLLAVYIFIFILKKDWKITVPRTGLEKYFKS